MKGQEGSLMSNVNMAEIYVNMKIIAVIKNEKE